ncbi:MAG TPA: pyruvate, phosphate dikinase [Candidatus Cybelea sp.]|nr:pyruvate, phosphate dikinase [Candidatus Cybelea sp.]
MTRGWYSALFGKRRERDGAIRPGGADPNDAAPVGVTPGLPVFDLDHDHGQSPRSLADLLGGKGAGLAELRQVLKLPVPPGFILGTPLCRRILDHGWPDALDGAIAERMAALERATGRRFGDRERPLLVSVRSGAPVSMPGMMDTVLNLGMNGDTAAGLASSSGDERFALDSWLTFCRMYAAIVLGLGDGELGAPPNRISGASALRTAIDAIRARCVDRGTPIPDDPLQQLRTAIEAVFRSWQTERAAVYRKRECIPDGLGTAVIVQAMVFGNMRGPSGTGVAFSRNPSTGANEPCGEFLLNAQGEAVVGGMHQNESLDAMARHMPAAHRELLDVLRRLEVHYADVCDVEFTVQDNALYVLQTRPGKRSALAAARIAVDLTSDPEIRLPREAAVSRVSQAQVRQLGRTAVIGAGPEPMAQGVPASPGIATGTVCTDPDRAAALAATGASVILVRPTTSPADVHGMVAASGIVTAAGGMMSHAALVARSWNIPAVCGIGDVVLIDGEPITIDGGSGHVYRGDRRGGTGSEPSELGTLRQWARELGTELGGSQAIGTDTAVPARKIAPFDAARALQLRGFASIDQLAISLASTAAAARDALDALDAKFVGMTARGLQLTAEGRGWVAAELARERSGLDRGKLGGIYEQFLQRDDAFKRIVTDWQVKTEAGARVQNDHNDAAYDRSVLSRLDELHGALRPLLAALSAEVPRLERYMARLDRAMAGIAAGDVSMIASPLKDSYHAVWFELHEELIALSGRDRMTEELRQK